jgi:aspartyl-tRNA(Asn)/glutamyl-tRNA(Gln) amidotransferase subunit B
MSEYKTTIGLEIHAELKTKSKMFCSCVNDPEEKRPNFNVCPVCLGHPGTLPVINEEAVKKVIQTGLSLNCSISEHTSFDRKSYFYPDLPKGYQITQYPFPLCKTGFLEVNGKKIRINRIHLEEDVGRLIHEDGYSLIDFNRAGIPLMELVTEPDMETAQEARKFAEEFQLILRYLNVSDANMEKGQMRVEANISISKDSRMGTKVEVKNLNSFRAVEGAINFEVERQKEVLESGEKVIQETRGWLQKKNETVSQRVKEEAHDYRYFPEPDLPPLEIKKSEIEEISSTIPELPKEKRKRFKDQYFLNEKEIESFVQKEEISFFFEKVVSELKNWIKLSDQKIEESKIYKTASNYILTDLRGLINSSKEEEIPITPENFAEFINLIFKGEISSKIAKMVLKEMFETKKDPSNIIKEKGLSQINDESQIEKSAEKVISNNPKAVQDFKEGKINALQFLIGQLMAETRGKTNPKTADKILRRLMKE